MTEPIPNPSPGSGAPSGSPDPEGVPRAPRLRGAASSSGPDPSMWLAWGSTVAVILIAGGALYAARSAVGSALDRWVPTSGAAHEAPTEEPVALLSETASVVEEDSGPEWTYVDIEAAITPLPDSADALIAEGRSELSQFTGLNSKDETRALLIRNRWRLWGRIWHNRVEQIRGAMPPLEECLIHAALAPTCRALSETLAHLDQVPSADRVADAKEHFTAAFQVLDELRNPPPEEDPETGGLVGDELAGDGSEPVGVEP